MKDPIYLGKAVLKNGGSLVTESGTSIITVSSAGVVAINTSTETLVDLTTTGNTVIGNASTDTVTMNSLMTLTTDQKLQFRDTGTYIYSTSANNLSVIAVSNLNLTGGGTTMTLSSSGLTGALSQVFIVTQSSATPSTSRVIYGKNVAFSSTTSGNLVGVRGEVNIPNSSTVNGTVFLYGAQGKLVAGSSGGVGSVTITAGSAHVCGVLGQLDISNCTTTSGHIAPVISSIQDSSGTARTAVNGFYAELPTYGSGALMNSVLQGVGAANYGFDLGGIGGMTKFVTLPSSVAGAANGGGADVYIDILINGTPARLTAKYVS